MLTIQSLALALALASGGDVPAAPAAAPAGQAADSYNTTGPFGTYYAAENVANYLEDRGYVTAIRYHLGAGWYVFYR